MAGIAINSNLASLAAQRRLQQSSASVQRSFEQLSSGLRISRAADDAAGLAIASLLNSDSRVFTQAIRNINDGVSAISIAEGGLQQLSEITQRQIELAQQAANGTVSAGQRRALASEANALVREYNRIVQTVSFNGRTLLSDSGASASEFTVQAGYGINGQLAVALGDRLSRDVGDGTFTSTGTTIDLALTSILSIQFADLTNDNIPDLLASGTVGGQGKIEIRVGNGDGTFGVSTSYSTGSSDAQDLLLGDLNGDDLIDIVSLPSYYNQHVAVRFANGPGTFGAAQNLFDDYPLGNSALVDVNGDSKLDLLGNGSSGAEIRIGNGNGTFAAANTLSGSILGAGDFNGDGKADIVTRTAQDLYLNIGNGDGSFRSGGFIATSDVFQLKVADINTDGYDDIVANAWTAGGGSWCTLTTYLGGSGGLQQVWRDPAEQLIARFYAEDFNGDGIKDIFERGAVFDKLMFGNGDGTFRLASTAHNDEASYDFAPADINSDGVIDLIGHNSANVFSYLPGTVSTTAIPLLDLYSQEDARAALPMLRRQLARISSEMGTIGACQSRLGTALGNLQVARENYDSAGSRITDIDVAAGAAELAKAQIIQQLGSAILSQANQQPALAIQLLKS